MWFIMESKTEKTIATTKFKDVAMMIAAAMPVECIIRYTPEWQYSSKEDTNFFETAQEMKKGA